MPRKRKKLNESATNIIDGLIESVVDEFPMCKIQHKRSKSDSNGNYTLTPQRINNPIHWQNMQFYGIDIETKKTILNLMRKYVAALKLMERKPLKRFNINREHFGVKFQANRVIRNMEIAFAYASELYGCEDEFRELYDQIQERENISWVMTRLQAPFCYVPDLGYANASAVRDYIRDNKPRFYKENETLLQKENFTIEEEKQVIALISFG